MPDDAPTPSAEAAPATSPPPPGQVIVGADHPAIQSWLAERNTPAGSAGGLHLPLFLVEPDAGRVSEALSAALASCPLAKWFVGGDGEASITDFFAGRPDAVLPNQLQASGPRVVDLAGRLAQTLRGLQQRQQQAEAEVAARLAGQVASRPASYWRQRLNEVAAGRPARVLIVTSRFTSFLKHSAEDLAEALRARGGVAEVLLETDGLTNMTALRGLAAVERLDPDWVVVLNRPRSLCHGVVPEGWPCVCWVQDAMSHLFQSPPTPPTRLDFLAGHIYPDTPLAGGYADDAVLPFPVPVLEAKFASAAPTSHDDAPLTCDIGYVSHQSQPAEALLQSILQNFGADQRPALERCYAAVAEVIDGWADAMQHEALEQAAQDLAGGLGVAANAEAAGVLRSQVVMPLAERMLRHQTLAWAAAIAQRHGLTLRLWGAGWEHHPTLKAYAAGPIPHGPELAACYARAGVHLHASVAGVGHQRVVECAFAGGLTLGRRNWSEFYNHDWAQMRTFMQQDLPADASLVKWKWPAYVIRRHAALQRIIDDRGRMPRPPTGWNHEHFEDVYAEVRCDPYFKFWDAPLPPPQMRPLELLGDPFVLTFSTEAELEEIVLRAVGDRSWRTAMSSAVAERARQRVSMRRFAQQMSEMVSARLRDDGSAEDGGRSA